MLYRWARNYQLQPNSQQEKSIAWLFFIPVGLILLIGAFLIITPGEAVSTAVYIDSLPFQQTWTSLVTPKVSYFGWVMTDHAVTIESLAISIGLITLQTALLLVLQMMGSWTNKPNVNILGLVYGLAKKEIRWNDIRTDKVMVALWILAVASLDIYTGYKFRMETSGLTGFSFQALAIAVFWENIGSDMFISIGSQFLIMGLSELYDTLPNYIHGLTNLFSATFVALVAIWGHTRLQAEDMYHKVYTARASRSGTPPSSGFNPGTKRDNVKISGPGTPSQNQGGKSKDRHPGGNSPKSNNPFAKETGNERIRQRPIDLGDDDLDYGGP